MRITSAIRAGMRGLRVSVTESTGATLLQGPLGFASGQPSQLRSGQPSLIFKDFTGKICFIDWRS